MKTIQRLGLMLVIGGFAFQAHAGNAATELALLAPEHELRMAALRPDPVANGVARAESESDPAFNLAIRPREYDFAESLLNDHADPQSRECAPGTELHFAVAMRDLRLLRRLLENGSDPNAPLRKPVSPSLIRLLGNDRAARVLAKDSRVTPLMLAAITGQGQAVRVLLKYGADTQIHTPVLRLYPLDFAAERGDVPMMQMILGRDPAIEGQNIVVSLSNQRVSLMRGGSPMLVAKVSTGRPGFRTPPGEYVVTQKYRSWKSSLYKVAMPNFMRLSCSQIGLHGGVVPNQPASHGCIRLPFEKAGVFYAAVQVGDRVSIVE